MSHEIYYTSAPQGLRPGQQGFCTVAATDGIPRPLCERLESLSGYRHADAGEESSKLVSWAHWIVRVGDRSHHVLSRICDAGHDYSQRNNIFAHHLALDDAQLAPAGPAWTLLQPGVMAQAWDGRVGAIERAGALPSGDAAGQRCWAWERAAGDAGWAGVLAEAFVRTPLKPVGILYEPGLDVLGLIDEAIRLLPAGSRWQITFNTYFTSLPGSAACAWRCCPVGSRLSGTVRRYAATGLLLDLTNMAGRPTDGPWVEFARTGRMPAELLKSAGAMTPAVGKGVFVNREKGAYALAGEAENLETATGAASGAGVSGPAARLVPGNQPRRRLPMPTRPEAMDEELDSARPWRKAAWLYVLAVLAIGIGTWLVIRAGRSMSPPDHPLEGSVHASRPVEPSLPATVASTSPVTPATATVVDHRPPATGAVIRPDNGQAAHHPPTAPIEPPGALVLTEPPPRPEPSAALRDTPRYARLAAPELAGVRGLSLRLRFAGGRLEYDHRAGDLQGSLVASQDAASSGVILRWKDALGATAADVVTVAPDMGRSRLAFTWKTSTVLRRPEVASLTWWLVRTTPMELVDVARGWSRELRPAPLPPLEVALVDGFAKIQPPFDFPASVTPVVEPPAAGWTVTPQQESDAPGSSRAEDVQHVIDLRKTNPLSATEQVVSVRFAAGLKSVQSTLAAKVSTVQTERARFDTERADLDARIGRLQIDATADMEQNARQLANLPLELKAANEARQARLAEDVRPLETRKAECDKWSRTYALALDYYRELASMDVLVKLPDGTRLMVLRLQNRIRWD